MITRLALGLLVAAAIAAPVSAQPAEPPQAQGRAGEQQSPIVVEGRAKDALRNFILSLTRAGPTDQIARWNDEVCPAVIGIDPAEASFMEDRISSLGQTVGLRASTPGCATKLAVIVSNDAS